MAGSIPGNHFSLVFSLTGNIKTFIFLSAG